jgi:hypothetical protein
VRYTVATLINEGEGRFFAYDKDDRLVPGPILVVDADSLEGAAEKAFAVGNRQGVDAEGNSWPSNVRSISSGDVVTITADDTPSALSYACGSFGWRSILGTDVLTSILFGKVSSRGATGFAGAAR